MKKMLSWICQKRGLSLLALTEKVSGPHRYKLSPNRYLAPSTVKAGNTTSAKHSNG